MLSAKPRSTGKSYLPVLCHALGMLVCGATFPFVGAMLGNELVTCLFAAIGMVGGGFAGGYIGSRWHQSRESRLGKIGPPIDGDGD